MAKRKSKVRVHPYVAQGLVMRAVWISPMEVKRLKRAVERSGMTLQEWLRRAVTTTARTEA
jgi:hypothetical protein